VAPLHRKISARSSSDLVPQFLAQVAPTAQALPPGPVVTPLRKAASLLRGAGTADQFEPFHRKISTLPTGA